MGLFFLTRNMFVSVITALNLTNFAEDGPLPADHMPEHRAFKSSHLAPFATNIQFQCTITPLRLSRYICY